MRRDENLQTPPRPDKPKPRRGLFKILVITVLVAVALALGAVGFLAWLLVPGGNMKPNLAVPADASPSDQARELMTNCLIRGGQTPVRSFLLYAENRTTGRVVHEGVGVVGRSEAPIDKDWRFNCASITKMFVATVVFQLEEEGKLSLDDPLSRHLGDGGDLRLRQIHVLNGEPMGDKITVAQLLSHRSGLGDIFIDTQTRFNLSVLLHPGRQYDPRAILETYFRYGLAEKPHFAPGTGYYYSDINYLLLGLLIEKVDGRSLPQSIRERILKPLAMDDTWFAFHEAPRGTYRSVDQYYVRINMTRYINTSYEWGGGSHTTTTRDLAVFIKALFGGKLFHKPDTLARMLDCRNNAREGHSYAHGIIRYELGGKAYWGHGGFYGSLVLHDPVEGVTLVANISQATAPFDPVAVVGKLLTIIGAKGARDAGSGAAP
jgi:D-alanyl-D-alanine carboxypeptidase